jgi:hypothetical protein
VHTQYSAHIDPDIESEAEGLTPEGIGDAEMVPPCRSPEREGVPGAGG